MTIIEALKSEGLERGIMVETVDICVGTKVVTTPQLLDSNGVENHKYDGGVWQLVAVVNVIAGFAYYFQKEGYGREINGA